MKMRVKVHNPGVDWGRTLFGLLGLLGLGAIIWLWFDFFFGHRDIDEKAAQVDFGFRIALSAVVALVALRGMRFIDCECGTRIPFTERQAGTRARCGDCAREYQLPSLSELRRGH